MTRGVIAAATVFCLGVVALLYGFVGATEALKTILVGNGLVLTAIGATWLAVELCLAICVVCEPIRERQIPKEPGEEGHAKNC